MKNKKYFFLSFLIPLVIMVLLYLSVGVIGGNKNILTVDLADQYVAFFNALKNVFDGKIGVFYSFSKTLGGNFFGIITYYLMSPFNLLILFFDRASIPSAILIINILKISFAGLTSYIYFNRTFKNNVVNLMFSIIYALMAYNIVYSQNIMWLDGVILLPLIFLGIDRLIGDKPVLFYVSISLSILCNYYIGYMSCIGSLIYFIYKDYLKNNKVDIKRICYFLKFLVLAVLTCSVVLIPSIFSLLSGKASGILSEFIPNQKFALFDLITRFYIGSFKNSDLEGGCPNLYISLISIVLVVYYFFNRKIDRQEKKASLILLLVFILSFVIYPIDVIWHTFKHPYGFPFRYSFIFDFVMLIIAQRSIMKLDSIDKEFVKKFIFYSFILTIVVDKLFYSSTSYYKVIGTFVLASFYLIFLFKKRAVNVFIVLLVISEMFINDFLVVINMRYQNKDLYSEFVSDYGCVIDSIDDSDFYRLEKDYSYSTNDELLLNYNGISHFSSIYEGKNNTLLGKYLGIFNRFYITNYNGSTLVTNSLFDIKYILSKDSLDYYDRVNTYKGINTYKNNYNLPLAFMVDSDLLSLKLEALEPFKNQNNILKSMDKDIEDVFIPISVDVTLNNLELDENAKNLTYKKINANKSASIVFKLNQSYSGILYAYLSSKSNKKVDILLNGKSIIDITDQNDFYYNILELGSFDNGEEVMLEVELLEDTLKLEDYMFYVLDMDKFSKAINILSDKGALKIEEHRSDYIRGSVQVNDDFLLYTSIPYDDGFTVTVDGDVVHPDKVLDTFMALKLEKGNHDIVIKYVPKGFKSGVVISLIFLLAFLFTKKKYKK